MLPNRQNKMAKKCEYPHKKASKSVARCVLHAFGGLIVGYGSPSYLRLLA